MPAVRGNPSASQARGPHVLSYSRIDAAEFVLRLYDELCAGPEPVSVWLDRRDILAGRDWDREIDAAIRRCEGLLFVLTRDSVHPDSICTEEWHLARACKKPIIPLLLHGDAVVPMLLARRQHIDFTGDFRNGVAELRRYLRFMASPEGELLATEDRLRDAERKLDRAQTGEERARIRPHIDELRRQIDEQREVLRDTERSIASVHERVKREPSPGAEPPVVQPGAVTTVNSPPLPPELLWYFVDRAEERSNLIRCLRNDALRLVLLAGPGGMGKTAMACRVLDEIERGQISDGGDGLDVDAIVYLDADGAPALSLPTILEDLAQLLPDEVRSSIRAASRNPDIPPARKMQELLAALTGRRVLILLDALERMLDPNTLEFRDSDLSEALEALLVAPAHGVKLICTTRSLPRPLMRVQSERQTFIDLIEGLQPPDAAELLKILDPSGALGLRNAEPDLLEEARRRTRGQPRALVALRRVLYVDDEKSLADLLEGTSGLLPDEVVDALIGEAFDRLERPSQLVMQALAVYGRPVSSAAVDYLLLPFLSGRRSEPLLRRLVDMYLLTPRTGRSGTRYSLDLTEQTYANELIPLGEPEDREADPVPFTQFALSHWGAEFCHQARRNAGRPNGMEDLQLHLMEVDLRDRAREHDAAAELLVEVASSYLLPWGQSRLVVEYCERLDGKLADRFLAYQVILMLAIARAWLGEQELAVPQFERARDMARAMDDAASESLSLVLLASCLYELGRVGTAGDDYKEALRIAAAAGDRIAAANALTGLALCTSQEGNTEDALSRYEEALAIALEVGDARLEATVRCNIGTVLGELGRTSQALDSLEQGLAVALAAGDHRLEGDCRSRLAAVLTDQGDLDRAIEQAWLAARIGDRTENPRLGQDGYEVLALAQLLMGEIGEARAAVDTACQRGADSRTRGPGTLALLGVIALRQQDESGARRAFNKARGRAESLLRAEGHRLPWVLDAKGLILTGLALCERDAPQQRLDDAVAAFRSARAISSAEGLINRVVRLLDALSLSKDHASLLARVRSAASGLDGAAGEGSS